MYHYFKIKMIFACFFGCVGCCFAGGGQSDYDRAGKVSALFRNKVFQSSVDAHWLADDSGFWYQVDTAANSHEFIFVDAVSGIRKAAFDHARLAKAMTDSGVKNVDAKRLLLEKLDFDLGARSFDFDGYGRRWQCSLRNYRLTDAGEIEVESLPAYSLTDAPKATAGNGKVTEINFINETKDTVELFWITGEGGRVSYGKLLPNQRRSQHTFARHLWLAAKEDSTPIAVYQAQPRKSKAVIGIALTKPKQADKQNSKRRFSSVSPDGEFAAFIRDCNIWLRNVETKVESVLSSDGIDGDGYTMQIYWSPDSQKLVGVRRKAAPDHIVYMVESSPKDQLQPKLHTIKYHKPGDVLDIDQPKLFDIQTVKQIPVANDLFTNPWSISHIRWDQNSSRFTFLYNQRGHQILRVIGVEGETGIARSIVEERSKTFISYSGKLYYNYLDGSDKASEIIWMSERDGYNHLYLYDATADKVKNQITKGAWVVRGVDKVDADKKQIWFRAGGIIAGQDPYYIHYCRVNFDGSGLVVLTEGDGTHDITFSPGRKYFVDTYSRTDMPPVNELRRSADGKLVCNLEHADWSELLKTGWKVPQRFVAKGRDGVTDIYGMIIQPTTFDPQKTYPIIENIYAGPHSSFVPKSFSAYFGMHQLAELGFILVKIDGMGTSNRSKKFHDVCYKNLADAGLDDRVKWIKAAAAKYPYMDDSHVGIYGGSAGGQSSATAVMTHGFFYKAAVSDCGCYDNRMDKVWWNEQWMGWPVDDHYEANSAVTLASGLKGKLLLTVGELDKNVDPTSTMQVVDALIKADKDFEMLVIPGGGHGAGEGKYGSRRRADFFVRHLMGKEPRIEP